MGEPVEPGVVLDDERGNPNRRDRAHQATRPIDPDRRRLRDVRGRLPLARGRAAAHRDPRLLVLQALSCTSWRLGVFDEDPHILDRKLAELPATDRAISTSAITRSSPTLRRSSSSIAWSPTAVTSPSTTPLGYRRGRQAQMAFLSLFALLDDNDHYQTRCREIIHERFEKLWKGLGVALPADSHASAITATSISSRGRSAATTSSRQIARRADRRRARARATPRHRAPQRQWLRRPPVVGARLPRESRRRGLRRDRP